MAIEFDEEGEREGGGEGTEEGEESVCDEHNMMNTSLLRVYSDNATSNYSTPTSRASDSITLSDTHSGRHGIETVPLTGVEVDDSIENESIPTNLSSIQESPLSHVMSGDDHVIPGDDCHMTGNSDHVIRQSEDSTLCGGDDGVLVEGRVRGDRGGSCDGVGGDGVKVVREEVGKDKRSKLKKVTFSPDVIDKQPKTSILKSPGVSRKRRSGSPGEGESIVMMMLSSHKKHKTHREHRGHRSNKPGKSGKGEKVGGDGRGEGERVEGAIKEKLKRTHSKSRFKVEQSAVTFSDVGGCQTVLKEVQRLLLHVSHPDMFVGLGIHPPQGVLLHGPPGCGKTLLASAIAGEMGLSLIRLAATEIVSGVSGESENTLRELFTLAKASVPCVLFIDEVDIICPKREMAQREMERRIVSQLLACVDDLHGNIEGSRVLLIAATTRPDSLDPAVRRSGRFDREICLGIPDEASRLSILQVLTRGLSLEPEFPFQNLAHQTPGYVGADLQALIREASLCAVNRLLSQKSKSQSDTDHTHSTLVSGTSCTLNPTGLQGPPGNTTGEVSSELLEERVITFQDFQLALQEVQPSAKREGFATVPDTSWEDVGALEEVREELSLAILAPVRYPDQFASLGLTTPPGILLAGPPGCGKTLLAKAIANESGINFISVKGPELLNMYVGESERAVRQVFQRARNSAPCVIFFDELDALCPKRSETAETSASGRVVNQLLTEMDGLQARRQVFIMAATNRPDIIDPAVLRPGRLDKLVYVGLPSDSDRANILNTITKNGTRPKLDQNVDVSTLASSTHTDGFSGADLKGLVREAAVVALKDYMQLQPSHWVTPNTNDQSYHSSSSLPIATGITMERSKVDVSDCVVTMKHFETALQKIAPSVSQKDRVFYEKMKDRFIKSPLKKK